MNENNRSRLKKLGVLSVCGVILVLSLVFSGSRQHRLTCRAIQIELPDSENFVTRKDVLGMVTGCGIHAGMKADSIKIRELEQLVSKNPFVQKADVSLDLAGRLRVKVSQKHPLLLVTNQAGQRFYVDTKGMKMPWFHYDTARFYQVRGMTGESYHKVDTLHDAALRQVFEYAKFIGVNAQRKKLCRTFYINPAHEIEVRGPQPGFYFVLGDTSSMDSKLRRMELMYSVIFPKEGYDSYSVINLKFDDQLVCTRKDRKNKLLNDIN